MARWTKTDYDSYLARQHSKPDVKTGNSFPDQGTKLTLKATTDEAKLNKLERDYLAHLRLQGKTWIGVQNITLKLGDDCRYTPDFWTLSVDELTAWEVKGFFRDDAKVKLKVAARQ